jgi:hypothetical protein
MRQIAVTRTGQEQPCVRTKSPSRQVDKCIQAFSAIIASNEEEDTYQLKIDRINTEACACEVALAITKLAFEGPIILKGFSAYFCGGGDDDLAQLELKNQAAASAF